MKSRIKQICGKITVLNSTKRAKFIETKDISGNILDDKASDKIINNSFLWYKWALICQTNDSLMTHT